MRASISNAMVYVNEDLAATQLYGYGNFYVVLDKYLNYGADNQIMVIANNVEPNSRWYSGSGIYRDVNLMVGARIHIPADGVRITTPTVEPEASVVEICVDVKNLSRDRERVNVVSHDYL